MWVGPNLDEYGLGSTRLNVGLSWLSSTSTHTNLVGPRLGPNLLDGPVQFNSIWAQANSAQTWPGLTQLNLGLGLLKST